MTELLTADEHEAIEHLAAAANTIRRVIAANGGNQIEFDWAEAADKIHQLQQMVMAQAASRAYPDRYRLLGGWPVTRGSEEV